jgi:hypothetical protein
MGRADALLLPPGGRSWTHRPSITGRVGFRDGSLGARSRSCLARQGWCQRRSKVEEETQEEDQAQRARLRRCWQALQERQPVLLWHLFRQEAQAEVPGARPEHLPERPGFLPRR